MWIPVLAVCLLAAPQLNVANGAARAEEGVVAEKAATPAPSEAWQATVLPTPSVGKENAGKKRSRGAGKASAPGSPDARTPNEKLQPSGPAPASALDTDDQKTYAPPPLHSIFAPTAADPLITLTPPPVAGAQPNSKPAVPFGPPAPKEIRSPAGEKEAGIDGGPPQTATEAAGEKSAPIRSYCVNIANAALDARYLRQQKQLEGLRADLQQRVGELEEKIAEFKSWFKRRDEFVNKARESLVSIYSSMKAEAAAKQIVELDEETASAVLAKLDARQSSAIMSEMDSKKAARLMEIIAGASKLPADGQVQQPKAGGEPEKKAETTPQAQLEGEQKTPPDSAAVTQ